MITFTSADSITGEAIWKQLELSPKPDRFFKNNVDTINSGAPNSKTDDQNE